MIPILFYGGKDRGFEPSQLSCAFEDVEEHRAREPACIGVLQRGMEAGDDVKAVGKCVFGAMAKAIASA
jgi:hypothetical protein